MTSQNGGQDGRHDPKMAAMATIQAQIRVTTSDDPVTRSVSPRKVSLCPRPRKVASRPRAGCHSSMYRGYIQVI